MSQQLTIPLCHGGVTRRWASYEREMETLEERVTGHGFINWVNARWREWDPTGAKRRPLTSKTQNAFDDWLEARAL